MTDGVLPDLPEPDVDEAARYVGVVGAGGFVGSSVAQALRERGHRVVEVTAPRLDPMPVQAARAVADSHQEQLWRLVLALIDCDAVVNCAGMAAPSSSDVEALVAANAALPLLVLHACATLGVQRFVHVSSAAVQGRRPVLDDTWHHQPFSDYARSKAFGETLIRDSGLEGWTIYRPGGVHGPKRGVTASVARVARSPFSLVVGTGEPTPQALVANVGDAIAFLATCEQQPPPVVTHPSEGVTTASVLRDLGGREPHALPASLARPVLSVAHLAGRMASPVAAVSRRLDTLWLGQRQAPSWLTTAGWSPPVPPTGWVELGRHLARS